MSCLCLHGVDRGDWVGPAESSCLRADSSGTLEIPALGFLCLPCISASCWCFYPFCHCAFEKPVKLCSDCRVCTLLPILRNRCMTSLHVFVLAWWPPFSCSVQFHYVQVVAQFICSSFQKHFGCFWVWEIMDKAAANICARAHTCTHHMIVGERERKRERYPLNPSFCNGDILHNIFKTRKITFHSIINKIMGLTGVLSIFTYTPFLPIPCLYLSVYSSIQFYCLCALLN